MDSRSLIKITVPKHRPIGIQRASKWDYAVRLQSTLHALYSALPTIPA